MYSQSGDVSKLCSPTLTFTLKPRCTSVCKNLSEMINRCETYSQCIICLVDAVGGRQDVTVVYDAAPTLEVNLLGVVCTAKRFNTPQFCSLSFSLTPSYRVPQQHHPRVLEQPGLVPSDDLVLIQDRPAGVDRQQPQVPVPRNVRPS